MCKTNSKDFVHLHGHTYKSKGDATSRPKELVKKAFQMGQKAIAVTDHGIASAWIEMAKACKEVTEDARKKAKQDNPNITEAELEQIGIKFIPGVEMYETDDRTIKSKNEMDALGYSTHHFLMLPKNETGLKNLNRIISDASWNGQFNARNRTDMDVIQNNGWGKGIVATSACLASRTSQYILDGRYDDAKQFALKCSKIFDEFYLELQDNNIKDQYIVNQALIQMSQETGLPLVYTQDYHYVDASDQDLHDTWICIGRNNEKHDPNRQGYDGGPYHLASNDEMYQAVIDGRIPMEAYENTVKIADQCNVEFNLKLNRFPKYKFIPTGYTAATYLRKKCFDALWDFLANRAEDGGNIPDAMLYTERLKYELDVINGKGYADYFLILDDVFGFCRSKGILTGPGRGSGAGSMVAYLLKITGLDPIKHKLLFERFLNPERMSSPDIDFDIQHDRRDELFEYIRQRFGADHVAQIVTYGQEKLRSAIDDLCRVLKETDPVTKEVKKYGQDLADVIKKTIPIKFPDQTEPTYEKMLQLATDPEPFREKFRDQTDKLSEQAKEFMNHLNQWPEIHTGLKFIEGLIRNYGRHAAAVVITDDPITDHIPVYRLNKDDILPVTAFNMKEVDEDLQMLKLDALSLSTETVVQRAVENIQVNNPNFSLDDIPENDEAAIKMIADGHTTGIFQVSGGPITAYTKKVKPTGFEHITDILGLFRPGPLEAEVKIGSGVSMADQYCENFYQDVLDEFLDEIPEELRYIYSDTRGILIYQEQINCIVVL